MNLLFTAHSYPPDVSGVAAVVGAVAEGFASRGHSVHVATGTLPGSPLVEVRNGVTVHRFDLSGNAVSGIKGDTSAFREFAASAEWDVVAMNHMQIWVTDALLPEIQRIPAARVYMGHGLSGFLNPSYQKCYQWFADRLTAFDRVFALPHKVGEVEFSRQNHLPSPVIVPNGVNLDEWSKPILSVREEWEVGSRPWIVNVSNHAPLKGHARLIAVADSLKSTLPALRTTIIGHSYPAAKWGSGRFGVRGGCWYNCRMRSQAWRCPAEGRLGDQRSRRSCNEFQLGSVPDRDPRGHGRWHTVGIVRCGVRF
jgi:glycosyltransferase involved in cell wall biosynthesis